MWKVFNESNNIDHRITKIIENELKFDKISKVQHEVIPRFSKNQDVIVKACTGSGKTLAYMVPMIQCILRYFNKKKEEKRDEGTYFKSENKDSILDELNQIEDLNNNYGIVGIIIVPTRELAMQVYNLFLTFKTEFQEIECVKLIGGSKLENDLVKFSVFTPNLIIATPTRLSDIEQEIKLSFKNLQMLVLDEADKLLELGYNKELAYLMEKFNKTRRTGVFSATINSQIECIVNTGMRNPIYIDVQIKSEKLSENFICSLDKPDNSLTTVIEDYFNKLTEIKAISQEVPKQLDNYYLLFEKQTVKFASLLHILKAKLDDNKKIMIFFATCNSVDYYNQILNKLIDSKIIFKLHSKLSQKKRTSEYSSFLKIGKGIILTTDLSSRGIDIPDLDVVIQFDPPKNEEVFVHRVGRTARVGKKGESILFIMNNHENKFLNYLTSKNIKTQQIAIDESQTKGKNKHKNIYLFPKLIDKESINEINKKIKEINLSDKWIYDKAVKAFVSYIKFYSEHDLKFIFDINLFDIGDLANSFQLLRLPRVKEILGKKIEGFVASTEINPHNLEYKDKNVRNQMELKAKKLEAEKEQRKIKKEISQIQKEIKNSRTRQDKKRTKNKNSFKEWTDLANEEKLYKKYKQGKISKEEYDELFLNNFN